MLWWPVSLSWPGARLPSFSSALCGNWWAPHAVRSDNSFNELTERRNLHIIDRPWQVYFRYLTKIQQWSISQRIVSQNNDCLQSRHLTNSLNWKTVLPTCGAGSRAPACVLLRRQEQSVSASRAVSWTFEGIAPSWHSWPVTLRDQVLGNIMWQWSPETLSQFVKEMSMRKLRAGKLRRELVIKRRFYKRINVSFDLTKKN